MRKRAVPMSREANVAAQEQKIFTQPGEQVSG